MEMENVSLYLMSPSTCRCTLSYAYFSGLIGESECEILRPAQDFCIFPFSFFITHFPICAFFLLPFAFFLPLLYSLVLVAR